MQRTAILILTVLMLLTIPALVEGQQLFKSTATWQNPTDTATGIKIEQGSGPGTIANYAPIPGSPFPPTTTTFSVLNLQAGTRYCYRWTRTSATLSGDPVEVCGTSDTKPGTVSGITIIFQPCPTGGCQ